MVRNSVLNGFHLPVVRAVLDQLVENLSRKPRVSNLRFRCAHPSSEATCGDSSMSNWWHFCHGKCRTSGEPRKTLLCDRPQLTILTVLDNYDDWVVAVGKLVMEECATEFWWG